MGQLALGFRSLLTKAAIFFVMAALLAWALGGTLWPRPAHAEVWPDKPASLGEDEYYWRVSIQSGRLGRVTTQRPTWQLMVVVTGVFREVADQRTWSDGAGPVNGPESDVIYFGGRDAAGRWWIAVAGDASVQHPVPDRLAVEQQLARLAAGLPMQDYETIMHQRSIVLDPADDESSAKAEGSRD